MVNSQTNAIRDVPSNKDFITISNKNENNNNKLEHMIVKTFFMLSFLLKKKRGMKAYFIFLFHIIPLTISIKPMFRR